MTVIASILGLLFGIVIFSIVTKYLRLYFVVRLFPGAVEQNLISKELSWKDSIILAIIFILISQSLNKYIIIGIKFLYIIYR